MPPHIRSVTRTVIVGALGEDHAAQIERESDALRERPHVRARNAHHVYIVISQGLAVARGETIADVLEPDLDDQETPHPKRGHQTATFTEGVALSPSGNEPATHFAAGLMVTRSVHDALIALMGASQVYTDTPFQDVLDDRNLRVIITEIV